MLPERGPIGWPIATVRNGRTGAAYPDGVHTAGTLRAVLRRGDFRRLLGTRLAGQLADGVFQASLAGSVFFNPANRADPMAVAIGFAVLVGPYSLLGPFAGVLLDRVSRRDVLVVANLVRVLAVPAAAAYVWSGGRTGTFFLLVLAVVGVNRFFLAGLSASLPRVVDPDRLVTANALSTTAGTVAFTTGGLLALGLLGIVGTDDHGYALVAGASALGYLASAAAARGFPAAYLGPGAAERAARTTVTAVLRGLVAGARHVAARRGAGYALLALTAHRVLFGVALIATLLLYRNHFTDGPVFKAGLAGLGQVVAAGALGALVAAAVTPWVTRHLSPRTWVTCLLLGAAVVEPALGLPYVPAAVVAASFAIGITAQGVKIVTDTAVQVECDDDYRGRVFSLYDTLFNVALVAGLFAGALTLPPDGRSDAVLAAIAAGYALIGAGYGWAAARWYRNGDLPSVGRPQPAGSGSRTVPE
jgi:MFS family permease